MDSHAEPRLAARPSLPSGSHHFARRLGHRLLRGVLLALLPALLVALLLAPAAADVDAAGEAPEWRGLVTLWHTMLDHSSDAIYSPALFDELAANLDASDDGLTALSQRRLVPEAVADTLRRLLHSRYEYIDERHYIGQARVSQSALEASVATAHWLVERELDLLRRAYVDPDLNRDAISASESHLAFQLTFIHHAEALEAGAEQRRQELSLRQETGEAVDWRAFENECQRRRQLLLDAYCVRRLRTAPPVQAVMPYLFALTRARPDGPSEISDAALPGL